MPYRVDFKKSAGKALAKLPAKDQRAIKEVIDALQVDPKPLGYIQLKGYADEEPIFRVVCDNYRILYTIKEAFLTVLVVAVGLRADVYTKFAQLMHPDQRGGR